MDPWEIGKNYPAKIALACDPKETLRKVEKALDKRLSPAQREETRLRQARVREAKQKALSQLKEKAASERERVPITSLALMEVVGDTLPANAVLVDETISSGGGLRTLLRSEDPKSYFGLRGGGIGWGLPAALGVKLALGDRPVVALVGDGSALYAIQGLWTAAHYGLGVVFVICNNGGYRILKQRTHALQSFSAKGNRYIGMDLEAPTVDFVGLARSLGVPGKRVEKTQEVRQALAGALTQGGPFLIDVPLDRGFQS